MDMHFVGKELCVEDCLSVEECPWKKNICKAHESILDVSISSRSVGMVKSFVISFEVI